MTKKKVTPTQRTYKSIEPAAEETKPAITIANLMTTSGISREQAEDMITRGVLPDSEFLQRYYGITAQAADTVIKIFEGK